MTAFRMEVRVTKLAMLAIVAGVMLCGSAAAQEEWRKNQWIQIGQEAVRERLKDPESAIFRDVYFVNRVAPVACGWFNAKNSFGGYGDWQRFIAAGDQLVVLESDMASTADMTQSWNLVC